jgi:hypothetical protein
MNSRISFGALTLILVALTVPRVLSRAGQVGGIWIDPIVIDPHILVPAIVLVLARLVRMRGFRVRGRAGGAFLRSRSCLRSRRGPIGSGLHLGTGGRLLRLGPSGWSALVVGGHAHVPPDGGWWVGPPDGVESRFGWVLPGRGIAVRPLPRLIHRRRFTVLCWSRDGTAPAPLACG